MVILLQLHFYLPSYVGQETAKGFFSLQVKLPPAHLSITLGGGFTLSLLLLNVKCREAANIKFYSLWFDLTEQQIGKTLNCRGGPPGTPSDYVPPKLISEHKLYITQD